MKCLKCSGVLSERDDSIKCINVLNLTISLVRRLLIQIVRLLKRNLADGYVL